MKKLTSGIIIIIIVLAGLFIFDRQINPRLIISGTWLMRENQDTYFYINMDGTYTINNNYGEAIGRWEMIDKFQYRIINEYNEITTVTVAKGVNNELVLRCNYEDYRILITLNKVGHNEYSMNCDGVLCELIKISS